MRTYAYRELDLAGHLLYFLNHPMKLSPQGSVEDTKR